MMAGFAGAAQAQQFTDAGLSFKSHVQAVCPVLATARSQPGSNADEQDLFLRCNAVLQEPAGTSGGLQGLTPQSKLLDQYFGVQDVASQSDASNLGTRANKAVSGRLNAIAGQMKSSGTASLSLRPVQLASLEDTPVGGFGPRPSRLDGFVSAGGFKGDQDTTSRELGFEQDGYWIAAGLDYQFSSKFTAGGALTYLDTSADFDGIGGVKSGGSLDSDGWSAAAYGVYMPTERLAFTGLISGGSNDFTTVRNIDAVDRNGTATGGGGQTNPQAVVREAVGDTSGDLFQASLRATYDLVRGATTVTPHAEISYYKADIDGFTETGAQGLNLRFDSQEVESMQIALGATVSHAVSVSWGVLAPYLRAQAVFETKDDAQSVLARYAAAERTSPASSFVITTNPADDFSGDIALGVSADFAGGFTAFAEYSTVVGLENVTYNGLALGLRKTF